MARAAPHLRFVLAAGGVKRHELEKLMGHASQWTTGIYTHLFRESYETVHAALDAVYGSAGPPRLVALPSSDNTASESLRF